MNIVTIERSQSRVTYCNRQLQLQSCDGHSVTNCISVMHSELDSILKLISIYGVIICKHDCKMWAQSLDCGVRDNDVARMIKEMLEQNFDVAAIKFNPHTLKKCVHKTLLIRGKV